MNQFLNNLIKITKVFLKQKSYIFKGKYGLKYLINPDSSLDMHILKKGIFGDYAATHLDKIIAKDAVIFDIGANAGLLTLIFAKKYAPKGEVYAYEPDRENFDQLNKNIKINNLKNIQAFPIAIQDNPKLKKITFNIRRVIDGDGKENRGLSSIIDIAQYRIRKVKASTSTIDSEVENFKLDQLDFLKIDVEGAEYQVLQGGKKTIKKYSPIIIYEYSKVLDKMMKKNNTIKCFNLLKSLGYIQYAIIDEKKLEKIIKQNNKISDVNIICFPRNKNFLVKKLL